MKKVLVLLFVLMLSIVTNLSAQDKYAEEFKLSTDKTSVSSYLARTSYEVLKTWDIKSIPSYYLSLSNRNDTVLRNAILSPNGRYNYPGDSLVYSWSEMFAETRVFHRELVVNKDMQEINLEVREGNPIPISLDRIGHKLFKFLLALGFLLALSSDKNEKAQMTLTFALVVAMIVLIAVGLLTDYSGVLSFDYFFILFLVILPPLLVSLAQLGFFRDIRAAIMVAKAERNLEEDEN